MKTRSELFPYSMRPLFIISLCMLGLLLLTTTAFRKAASEDLVNDILRYTNQEREKKSLKPLIADEGLNELARKHSENMASGRVAFSHKGFDDRSKKARVMIPTAVSFAENVAFGPMSGKEVVDGWMKSSGHRTNILSASTRIGIGVATNKRGVIYYTQLFAGE